MPKYRCLQRTTLPGGALALPGEVHDLPANSHRMNVWEYVTGQEPKSAGERAAERAATKKAKQPAQNVEAQ